MSTTKFIKCPHLQLIHEFFPRRLLPSIYKYSSQWEHLCIHCNKANGLLYIFYVIWFFSSIWNCSCPFWNIPSTHFVLTLYSVGFMSSHLTVSEEGYCLRRADVPVVLLILHQLFTTSFPSKTMSRMRMEITGRVIYSYCFKLSLHRIPRENHHFHSLGMWWEKHFFLKDTH